MDENAFKDIDRGCVTVELGGCRDREELHRALKAAFGLPESYGMNWDALWDCLSSLYPGAGGRIRILGLDSLPQEVRTLCRGLLAVLHRLQEQDPELEISFEG